MIHFLPLAWLICCLASNPQMLATGASRLSYKENAKPLAVVITSSIAPVSITAEELYVRKNKHKAVAFCRPCIRSRTCAVAADNIFVKFSVIFEVQHLLSEQPVPLSRVVWFASQPASVALGSGRQSLPGSWSPTADSANKFTETLPVGPQMGSYCSLVG
jgi:hypothetical protein